MFNNQILRMYSQLSNLSYSKIKKLSLWVAITLFYSFQMGLRVLPAIIADYLSTEFDMDADEIGMLAGIYYLGYASMQIPSGVILDKYNPRIVIPSMIMLVCAGLLVTIYGSTKIDIYFARFAMGMGASAGFLGAIRASDDFFPEHYSSFVGFTVLLGVLGIYLAGAPLAALIEYQGEEASLLFCVYILLAIAAYIMMFYRRPAKALKAVEDINPLQIIKYCLTHKKLLLLAVCAGAMIGPFGGFADMWGIRYLIQVKGMSLTAASFSTTMIFFGFGVASPAASFLSNFFKSAIKFVFFAGSLQIVMFLVLLFVKSSSVYVIAPLCFVIGLLFCWQIAVYTLAQEITKLDVASAVTSIINMFMILFAFMFNVVTGYILKNYFSPVGAKLVYDQTAYLTAFSFMVSCSIAGVVGFMLLSKLPALRRKNI